MIVESSNTDYDCNYLKRISEEKFRNYCEDMVFLRLDLLWSRWGNMKPNDNDEFFWGLVGLGSDGVLVGLVGLGWNLFLLGWLSLAGSTLVDCGCHCDTYLIHISSFSSSNPLLIFAFSVLLIHPEQGLLHRLQRIFAPLRSLRDLSSLAWAPVWFLFGEGPLKDVALQRVHLRILVRLSLFHESRL